MGGASSKPDAFIGNSNSNNSKEAPCSCLTPFFCPPQHNSSASTRHTKTKSFGSPLPDTPEKVRRIRDHDHTNNTAAANGYYYNEETKLSAAQTNNNDELRSSKYGGLEKEINGMFSYENQSGVDGGGGDGVEDTCADIHDGKVSVECCYLLCILYVHCYFALFFLHSVQLYSLKLFILFLTITTYCNIQIFKFTGCRSKTILQIRHSRSPRSRLHLHLPPLHRTIHQRIPRLQNHRQE